MGFNVPLLDEKLNNHSIKLGWAVFGLALLVRLVYFFNVQQYIWFSEPIVDSRNFHEWAMSIIEGSFLGEGVFTQSPLYAYFLALIYAVVGVKPVMASLIQLLLGAFSSYLIFLLGKKVFNTTTGLIAGILSACYGMSLFHEGTLLTVSLIHFINCLLLLATYWAIEGWPNIKRWFVPGVLLGLSIIARPNIGLFFGVLLIVIALLKGQMMPKVKAAFFLGLGLILFIAPVTIRNVIVVNEPILTVNTGGLNFYLGNSRQSKGFHVPFGELGQSARTIVDDFRNAAQKRERRQLTYAESSRFWFKQTLREIQSDGAHWQQLLFNKMLYFWNNYELTTSINYYRIKELAPILRWPWISFGIIAPLALVGFIGMRREWRNLLPLYGFVGLYFFSNIILMVSSEYRYAVMPVFFLGAGWTVHQWLHLLNEKNMSKWLIQICLVTCLGVLSFISVVPQKSIAYRQATAHHNFGSMLMRLGDYKGAQDEFRRSVAYDPSNPNLIIVYGDALNHAGQFEKALEVLNSGYPLAPDDTRYHTSIANALTALARYEEAVPYRKKALSFKPNSATLLINYIVTLTWMGKDDEARKIAEKLVARYPDLAQEIDETTARIMQDREKKQR